MATRLQTCTASLLLAVVCMIGVIYFYTSDIQETVPMRTLHQQREFNRNKHYGNLGDKQQVSQSEVAENRDKVGTDPGNTARLYQSQEMQRFNSSYHYKVANNLEKTSSEKSYQNQETQRFNKSYYYTQLGNTTFISNPVKHIAFLKVHKAASSTIQNIFLRYGIKNNLVFVLPKTGYTISLKQSVEVGVNVFPPPPNKSYDILCNHVIYNRLAFEKVMPKDAVYIGTVREPFSQFISNIRYAHTSILSINSSRPVLTFLRNADKYINRKKPRIPATYNRMARDFGFPQRLFVDDSDQNRINKYLYKLDQDFDLVIVTEYFDESMILMRRLLKWEIADILYLKHKQSKNTKITTGDEEKVLYRKWAKLDHKLYNFFVRRLLRTISLLGTEFYEEVKHYQYVRNLFDKFCNPEYQENQSIPLMKSAKQSNLIIEESPWNKKFVILESDCTETRRNPRTYYPLLRKRQYGL